MGKTNKYAITLPVLFMAMACVLVSWFSYDSYQRFKGHQVELAKRSATATASAIADRIKTLRHSIGLFVQRENELLEKIRRQPADAALFTELSKKIETYLPGFYSFTLADANGIPQLKHTDFMLTKSCRRDLHFYARDFKAPNLYVHKFNTPDTLHFDLMTRFETSSRQTLPFFVSFKMSVLANSIKSGTVAGHKLSLVQVGEAISKSYGLENNNGSLKLTRMQRTVVGGEVLAHSAVTNSNWVIVDTPVANLFSNELFWLLLKAVAIILVFGLVAMTLGILIRREARQLDRTGRVILGIEKDRRRIAMDMHDQVLSDLTFLSRQCDHMKQSVQDPQAIKNHLEASEGALETVSNSIRSIIDDLHPQALEILGLEDSLKAYLDKNFAELPAPAIRFSVNSFEDGRLSDDQRLNLFRITLEIIHNIVRHANATRCDVNLSMRKRQLILEVEDNGHNFNPGKNKVTQARGLANISTRSHMIGGVIKWGLATGFDNGTRFELEMPLSV